MKCRPLQTRINGGCFNFSSCSAFSRRTTPWLWRGLNSSCWRNVTQLASSFTELNREITSVFIWTTTAWKISSRWSAACSLERRLLSLELYSLRVRKVSLYLCAVEDINSYGMEKETGRVRHLENGEQLWCMWWNETIRILVSQNTHIPVYLAPWN